ncbi:hypothetical protein [Pseudoruminococcus massiliensis]|uniref:hypothetical protein n=1 Tax=Pseudoruminococcus massiliensis TaxID=2086583 RepID=UPI003FD78C72
MATKSQLKQYFETSKIPTQAQFAELINSFINIPSRNTEDRGNQNLFFGNGEENPYIQGVRTVSKIVGTNVITMFIFSTHNNNDNASSFPLFILNRVSTRAASLNDAQATLRYCIPNKLNIDNFVMHGLDCDNSTDDEIITKVIGWEFKPFEKDNFNHNILNICTNISGTFSTFVFNLADINVEGNSKTLPIELMVIIDDNARITVDGPYYIKDTSNEDSFLMEWDALTSLLNKSYGTITTTNNMVVTRCNNIKKNYMEKR